MTKIIGLGDSYGAILNKNKELIYPVRLDDGIIYLTKKEYNLWQLARMAIVTLDKFPQLLKQSEVDFNQTYSSVKEKQIILEWPEQLNEQLIEKYIFVPIGFSVGTDSEGNQLIRDYIDAEPIALSPLPYYIWSEANPILNIKTVKHQITEVFNMNDKQAMETLQIWIPLLMANGLGTIVPLSEL